MTSARPFWYLTGMTAARVLCAALLSVALTPGLTALVGRGVALAQTPVAPVPAEEVPVEAVPVEAVPVEEVPVEEDPVEDEADTVLGDVTGRYPLEPPDTSSPRATLRTFLTDAREAWRCRSQALPIAGMVNDSYALDWVNAAPDVAPISAINVERIGVIADFGYYALLTLTLLGAVMLGRSFWGTRFGRVLIASFLTALFLYGFLYYGNYRYRLPYEPVMIVVAATLLTRMWDRVREPSTI